MSRKKDENDFYADKDADKDVKRPPLTSSNLNEERANHHRHEKVEEDFKCPPQLVSSSNLYEWASHMATTSHKHEQQQRHHGRHEHHKPSMESVSSKDHMGHRYMEPYHVPSSNFNGERASHKTLATYLDDSSATKTSATGHATLPSTFVTHSTGTAQGIISTSRGNRAPSGIISTSRANRAPSSQPQPASPSHAPSARGCRTSTNRYRGAITPGAVAVYYDDGMSMVDDSTIVIGDSTHNSQQSSSGRTVVAAVEDAFVVDPSLPQIQEQQTQPPLVDAQVDTSWTLFSSKKQSLMLLALLLTLVVIGIVVGVLYGVVWKDDDDETQAPIVSPPSTTLSPTASPTVLAWKDAGNLDNVAGGMLALSAEGKLVAVVDSTSNTTIRVHQQWEIDGTWVQLGATINVSFPVNSLSLAGTRLAVGSIVGNETSVLELAVDSWTLVASPITLEGWTVLLSQDGAVLAVESSDSVQVYAWDAANGGWMEKGGAIATTTTRVNPVSAYSRLAMNADGNTLIVDLSVYTYDSSSNEWIASLIPISSSPPNTPVSMSADGLVVAIAQPQSNVNGLNSGKVSVFRIDGDEWRQEGDDIIGDGQIRGFWGWSHSLSGNASRIAIMNNPDGGGTNQASVFYLQGSRWIRLLEQMPFAASNGTIVMSEDGTRIAVGGEESTVRIYDIVGM